MNDAQQTFYHLAVAIAVGLLIGLERGWQSREMHEGERVAGVRTHGLISLLGGGCAQLAERLGPLPMSLALVGMMGLLTTVYVVGQRRAHDVGITSLVAALLSFVLGAMAGAGQVAPAAAAAVVTTLLLSYKPALHRWVGALQADELRAGLKLLLISVVLLPVLPDHGYGPWQALNPYAIWWMVVLIAAISFIGYFAIKGTRSGVVLTGLFGGLVSSTALTLHFARMGRQTPTLAPVLAASILLACGTMFVRMLILATAISPAMLEPMLVPAVTMMLGVYLPALWFWHRCSDQQFEAHSALRNPLELRAALSFGVLLAIVMLLGQGLQTHFGDAGVLALAAASGIADVDAITLSVARMSHTHLPVTVAALCVIVAAVINSLTKAVMAAVIGGRSVGLRVGVPLLFAACSGLASAALVLVPVEW